MMVKKIDKDTKLKEIFEIENLREVLIKHKIPCLFCPFASLEIEKLKIGDICRSYGINEKKLIDDLNKTLLSNSKSSRNQKNK